MKTLHEHGRKPCDCGGECLICCSFSFFLIFSFPFSRGKTNYINLGSFLIKPVQRVMRYPLLLMELLGATPEGHHDRPQLTEALQAVKEINVNINEYKRRKDLGKKKKQTKKNCTILSARCFCCCFGSGVFPVSSSPSAVHSGEVQERGRGHVH